MRRSIGFAAAGLFCAAPAALAAAEGEGGGHALNFELWKSVNFVLLAAVLGWLAYKHLPSFFAGRTRSIQKEITEARELKEKAEARAAEMESRMANLEHQIAELREEAKAELAAEEARIQEETERAAARLEANARGEIASATAQARRELRAFAAELAVDLARRKVEERMTPQIQMRLVDTLAQSLQPKDRKRT